MIRADHHRDRLHHLQASGMIDPRDHHHPHIHHQTNVWRQSCGAYNEFFSTARNECLTSCANNPPHLQEESPVDFSFGNILQEWPSPPQLQPINTRSIKDLRVVNAMTQRPEEYNNGGRIRVEAAEAKEGEDQDGQQVKSRKKKRNRSTSPEEELEVVALSPRTLMAANRFFCEVCGKGFPREQNLQLHLRQHNLPGKLLLSTAGYVPAAAGSSSRPAAAGMMMSNSSTTGTSASNIRRVFVCPEESCPHHIPSRALSDLTGIRKHYSRKHGERQWRCDRCLKAYAVHSDWKAHSKICGSRDYRCRDCGEVFNRKDNYNKHRDYCKALADERAMLVAGDHVDGNTCHNQNISTGDDLSDHIKNVDADINAAEFGSYGGTLLNSKREIASNCSLDDDLALTIWPPAEASTRAGICLINATYSNSSAPTVIHKSDSDQFPQLELSLGPSIALSRLCDKSINQHDPSISMNQRSDTNIVFSNSSDDLGQHNLPMPHQVVTTLILAASAHTQQLTTTYEGTTRDFLSLGG